MLSAKVSNAFRRSYQIKDYDEALTLIEFLQILAKNLGVVLQRETMTSLKLPLVSLFTCLTRSLPNIV